MNEIGQDKINKDNMFESVMKKFPSLNMETVITAMMSPKLDYNDLTLWYGNITETNNGIEDKLIGRFDDFYMANMLEIYPNLEK